MIPTTRMLFIALACAQLCGCATSAAGASSSLGEPITPSELAVGRYTSAMDAVARLRPRWTRNLRRVYLDGQRSTVEDLQAMPVQAIREISLITADEAVTRYGAPLVSGNVLEVRTGR